MTPLSASTPGTYSVFGRTCTAKATPATTNMREATQRWDLSKLPIPDTPFQGNVTDIDFWRHLWNRFRFTRVRAPQRVFFLISMEWSAEKGIRRSGSQVPVNTFVSLAAFTSLPCKFSLTLHLNLRHFDCLSAGFISTLLFCSEASLLVAS